LNKKSWFPTIGLSTGIPMAELGEGLEEVKGLQTTELEAGEDL